MFMWAMKNVDPYAFAVWMRASDLTSHFNVSVSHGVCAHVLSAMKLLPTQSRALCGGTVLAVFRNPWFVRLHSVLYELPNTDNL